MREALERAIEKAGSQSALARAIGGKIKQAHVWYWLEKNNGRVPAEHCSAVESATGVSKEELRPDVFPSEDKAA